MSILVGGHAFTNQMIMGILNELRANYSNANELVCNLRHQSIQALTDLLNKTENKTIDLSELDYDILVSKVTTPPLIDIAKYVFIKNGDIMVGTEFEDIDAYDCDAFDLATIATCLLEQENKTD